MASSSLFFFIYFIFVLFFGGGTFCQMHHNGFDFSIFFEANSTATLVAVTFIHVYEILSSN